jgi:hypothetical protein
MTFYGNSFFPFQIHIIEHLVHHLPFGNCFGMFKQTIGQGTFAVIDMSDDTEIANVLHNEIKARHLKRATKVNG